MADPIRQRIDKWLWCARLVRQREQAAGLVTAGQVRLNRQKIAKPGHAVGPGDVLTVAVHGRVRVLEVLGVTERRGPAAAAAGLYRDLSQGAGAENLDATPDGTC